MLEVNPYLLALAMLDAGAEPSPGEEFEGATLTAADISAACRVLDAMMQRAAAEVHRQRIAAELAAYFEEEASGDAAARQFTPHQAG